MTGFGTVYWYELKKIFSNKALWVAAAVLLYWSAACFAQSGRSVTIAGEDIKVARDSELALTGTSIDGELMEKIYDMDLEDLMSNQAYNGLSYWLGEICVNGGLAIPVGEGSYELPWAFGGESALYEARLNWVQSEWTGQQLTETEQAYWLAYEEALETPFTYSYFYSYELNVEFIGNWFIVQIVVLALCLCPVFADEFRYHTDQLLRTCRNGIRPLYRAKILAGITAALALSVAALAMRTLFMGIYHGFEGFDAQIQLVFPASSWNLTLGQAMLILYALVLAASCFIACFVMLLSLVSKNGVIALAVPVGILLANLLVSSPANRVLQQLQSYFPSVRFQKNLFTDNWLVSLGPLQCNAVEFSFILYLVLAVLLTVAGMAFWGDGSVPAKRR